MDADQLNTLERAYELAKKARDVFGDEAQDMMLVEEASELSLAVSQYKRNRVQRHEVEAEAADVIIVAIGALGDTGWGVMRAKLNRLSVRLSVSPTAALEAENARLRAEIERLSGNGPLVDPRLP